MTQVKENITFQALALNQLHAGLAEIEAHGVAIGLPEVEVNRILCETLIELGQDAKGVLDNIMETELRKEVE